MITEEVKSVIDQTHAEVRRIVEEMKQETVKPGWRTTEFLFCFAVFAAGFYMVNWGPSVGAKEAGTELMKWSMSVYAGSRVAVKVTDLIKS